MNPPSSPYYGIGLLDDLHTYFPDLLYSPHRFTNVQQVLDYIRRQARNRFDRFTSAERSRRAVPSGIPPVQLHVPLTSTTYPISPTVVETVIEGAIPHTAMSSSPLMQALWASLLHAPQANMDAFNEPVPITPTPAEIEEATELRGVGTNEENMACVICQGTFVTGQGVREIRHCHHAFHRNCIDTWFQSHPTCPTCRFDIRQDNEED